MIRWSIATVCLGGGLEGKLAASAPRRASAPSSCSRTTSPSSPARRATRAASPTTSASRSSPCSRCAISRARRPPAASASSTAPSASSNSRANSARRCSACAPASPRTRSPTARRSPPTSPNSPISRASTASDSATRLCPGAATSGTGPTPGRSSRKADRPNLGIVLDSFHICVRDNPLAPIADLPAEKIALVQVADAPALQMDPMSLSRHYRCHPGQGDYPIVDYLDAVLRAGYRGPVSLEIFNEQFRGASAAGIAVDGMRALLATGEALAAPPRRTRRARHPRSRRAAAGARRAGPVVPGVRGFGEGRRRTSPLCSRASASPRAGAPSQQGGRSLFAGRHPFRRQPREALVRARLPTAARPLGLRHDACASTASSARWSGRRRCNARRMSAASAPARR